jgi:Uma2 family endonuclease
MSVATSTVPTVIQPALAVPGDFIWRLSVEQYREMIRAGILTEDDPVELIEGWLIPKMPKNPPHRIATRHTQRALESIIPAGWYVDTQEPITLADSEPEPDVTIARGATEHYLDHHPGPPDVALVVEIADSTLERDRGLKQRAYARAEVPVYWIVNLVENQLEVYTAPSGPTETPDYGQRRDYALTEAVPLVIEEQEIGFIPVRELFP